jgi:glutamyl-tRNA synthetase
MKPARTRFAPSPTGYLHVGGVRTALFNYLWAKKTGGQFILRLEDTDQERFVPEGVQQIVQSLGWLGLEPDEGFWISDNRHQSIEYVQSERHKLGVYEKYVQRLIDAGLAYYSVASDNTLEKFREEDQEARHAFVYRFGRDQNDSFKKPTSKYVIRFHAERFFKQSNRPAQYTQHFVLPFAEHTDYPQDYHVCWKTEEGISAAMWHSGNMEDFILIKSDGFPTYNFANVVDDISMGITHVMRGSEFISSTYKHIALYAALETPEDKIPTFVHLPVINGTDGKKLSKRTGDTNALDYRDNGYLDDALINFLALLGWNDGTEKEVFSLHELEKAFDLKRINKSPAIFDLRRLQWMNAVYIRNLPLDFLYTRTRGYNSMPEGGFWPKAATNYDETYKKKVLALVQDRLRYLGELPELTNFFFEDLPVDPKLITEHKQLKKLDKNELKDLLEQAKTALEASDFSAPDLTERLNKLLEQTGQKPAVLFSLVRIATTQAPASPGLADTLAVLGKERSLKRLDAQLSALN